ncbi:hypothetical protein CC86DRAFT_466387 [Ophiobolus disseminans]|uniref:Uncharacterized protein n=1 Tax=Ophiobolus disseminans TaxID=1469910 RepID=A0A6A7A4Z5_9PLEO|nr:hypothetical protein CC86DRAFT_466387 [Ophiobolus disseminans]
MTYVYRRRIKRPVYLESLEQHTSAQYPTGSMKLNAILFSALLPTITRSQQHAISQQQAHNIPAEQDLLSRIHRLSGEIVAMRNEMKSITRVQQPVGASTLNAHLDIDKLRNDIITAMREEIWAVNQMQLAAFYENHARDNSRSNECCKVCSEAKAVPSKKAKNTKILLLVLIAAYSAFVLGWLVVIIRKYVKHQLLQQRRVMIAKQR